MRNLKKFLALVLAMMMVFSMMITVNAATPGTDFDDDASITKYDEAVQVLNALGVFRGKGTTDTFKPGDSITRAEVAALVYRIVTGDVDDTLVKQDEGYTMYDDIVDENYWANGYINYVTIGDYMVGVGNHNFAPTRPVTGYEVLATILRAIGYDKNGEFRGATWKTYTSSKARELGITDGITATELNDYASRELVAELLFRVITQTSLVQYTAITRDYENVNGIGGSDTANAGMTLGYSVFKLSGGNDLSNSPTDTVPSKTSDTGAENFNRMSNRMPVAADDKYGEPYAVWHLDEIDADLYAPTPSETPDIMVRFNPTATYTTAVSAAALFSAGYRTASIVDGGYEDGDSSAVTVTPASGDTTTVYGGNGTVTELYKVGAQQFVVIKNTYAAKVKTTYVAQPFASDDTAMALQDAESDSIDYPTTGTTAAKKAAKATHAGLAANTLVIYNKYKWSSGSTGPLGQSDSTTYVDYTTIHAARSVTAEVTDTYKKTDADDSYFRTGSTKYEYDTNFLATAAGTAISIAILEHDDLVNASEEVQDIYFDDYGYVIYAEPSQDSVVGGFLLVVNETYTGRHADNAYWNTFEAYDMTGKKVSVQGAIGGYFYDGADEAKDSNLMDTGNGIGLYSYKVDSDNHYMLTRAKLDTSDFTNKDDEDSNLGTIFAGDPYAIDSTDIIDSDTVFVVATYNAKTGVSSGYKVYTGVKGIPDIKDGDVKLMKDDTGTDIKYAVEYVQDTTWATGSEAADETIKFVFVTGAKTSNDVKGKAWSDSDVFYITDETPELHLAEGYARYYDVIVNGKIVDHLDVAWGEQSNITAPGLYRAEGESDGLLADISAIDEDGAAPYVLLQDTAWGGADVLKTGDDTTTYIVLADNAKVYNLTLSDDTLYQLSAAEIKAIAADSSTNNVFGIAYHYDAYVAAKNEYGFATIVYLIVDSGATHT